MPVDGTVCSRCAAVLLAPDIEIDWSRREVRQGPVTLVLGPLQIDILAVLFRESPRYCRTDRIVARVYGYSERSLRMRASVRTTICLLRRRIGAAGIPLAIEQHGNGHSSRGYRLVTPGFEQRKDAA